MILRAGLGGSDCFAEDRQTLHTAERLFINLRGQCRDIDVCKIRAIGKGVPVDRNGILRQLYTGESRTGKGFIVDLCDGGREDKVGQCSNGREHNRDRSHSSLRPHSIKVKRELPRIFRWSQIGGSHFFRGSPACVFNGVFVQMLQPALAVCSSVMRRKMPSSFCRSSSGLPSSATLPSARTTI